MGLDGSLFVLTEESVYEANKKYKQELEGNFNASNVLDMLITNYAHCSSFCVKAGPLRNLHVS